MKRLVLAIFVLAGTAHAGEEPFGQTGFSDNTTIIEAPGPDQDCPGVFYCNWDFSVENGYDWQFSGVVPPDYGAFAECYAEGFVCEAEFYFTQIGYYSGQAMDVYLWDDTGIGSTGDPAPGNVICALMNVLPGPIAFWPACSAHRFVLNCAAPDHFIGFWGHWPGLHSGWYICADENGLGLGCPVTKFAPGIGYVTGWGPVSIVPFWDMVQGLGICEWVGPTSSVPDPNTGEPRGVSTTWGKIKTLYR